MTEANENVAATVSVKMETFISHFLKYSYYKNGKCLYDFIHPHKFYITHKQMRTEYKCNKLFYKLVVFDSIQELLQV